MTCPATILANLAADLRAGRDPGDVAAQLEALASATVDRRHELLAEARERFLPDLSDAAAADALHTAWSHYAATGWRRDRQATACPPHRVGRLEALFFDMMQSRDRVLSARQIRRLIAC